MARKRVGHLCIILSDAMKTEQGECRRRMHEGGETFEASFRVHLFDPTCEFFCPSLKFVNRHRCKHVSIILLSCAQYRTAQILSWSLLWLDGSFSNAALPCPLFLNTPQSRLQFILPLHRLLFHIMCPLHHIAHSSPHGSLVPPPLQVTSSSHHPLSTSHRPIHLTRSSPHGSVVPPPVHPTSPALHLTSSSYHPVHPTSPALHLTSSSYHPVHPTSPALHLTSSSYHPVHPTSPALHLTSSSYHPVHPTSPALHLTSSSYRPLSTPHRPLFTSRVRRTAPLHVTSYSPHELLISPAHQLTSPLFTSHRPLFTPHRPLFTSRVRRTAPLHVTSYSPHELLISPAHQLTSPLFTSHRPLFTS
uniref:SWIM-type domain-containing protein n=1 Tax=Eptatretus burgeri TaxID=7764 RepID=A0A8C4PZ69_EPTBU